MTAFSIRLKELRREAMVSQQELSVAIGISKSSINMYERGEREPGLEMVKKFAEYFDVNTDYILGKSDDKRSVRDGIKYSRMVIDMLENYRKAHGLTRAQMETYLDWEGMYEKIESRRIIMSEDWLCNIENMLKVLDNPMSYVFEATRVDGVRPVARKRLPMLGNVACGEPIFADEQHDTYVDAVDGVEADFCLTAKGDSMINARIFDGDILFVKQQESVDDGEIAVVLIEDETTVKRVYYDRENNIITLVPENPMHKPMRFEGAKLEQIRILGKVIAGHYTVR